MTAKLSIEDRRVLVRRATRGENVSQLCRENGISRVVFYRWIKRFKEEGEKGLKPKLSGRPKEQKKLKKNNLKTHKLSPNARLKMIQEVVDQSQSISDVSQKYEVSRNTIYKWLKRYYREKDKSKDRAFIDKKPQIDRYWRQTPEKYEEAVLSLVSQHPEYGVRRIVASLPKVGDSPIVGHHGVQNVLYRNKLSRYEDRLEYAKGKITPITLSVSGILEFVAKFFGFAPDIRRRIIHFVTVFSISTFGTVVIFGLFNFINLSFSSTTVSSPVGIFFACVALGMGSLFFLYSLKYYLTLGIVLSFSQSDGDFKVRKTREGFISWLLGGSKDTKPKKLNRFKASGLNPNLDGVKLNRYPFISIHIPFYNEKNVVERSIEAVTNFDYKGEYEVILCDDSSDETTSIIKRYQKGYLLKGKKLKVVKGNGWVLSSVKVRPGVTLKHLHRTNRSGFKGGALEIARTLSSPKTEFVSVFDADFVPYPDTLELFLKYFKVENNMSENLKNTNIGAVQGYQWHVLNKSENWITRGVRSEYAGSYVIERSGIEIYGGLKQISGSVYMIRKDVLDEVKWGTSITEDFELTLRLYNSGYKVVYTPYIQAPAECVSTAKRLIKQRMRWAEGHSYNIKKMFKKLILNPKISFSEKIELSYLSPYYLQAFFFLTGTLSWLISETVFVAHLPFWTELWGWSLVLTNMFALPLVNAVGMFLEESEERDYLGLASFMALSYILVPFQAYASLRGFLEKEEGPWFRTPKTGKITDVFTRGQFYKFISGIIPRFKPDSYKIAKAEIKSEYLTLSSGNNQFNSFLINKKKNRWVGKVVISILLCFSVSIYHLTYKVSEVEASIVNNFYLSTGSTDEDSSSTASLYNSGSWQKQGAVVGGTNSTLNNQAGTYWFYSRPYPTDTYDASVAAGTYYYDFYVANNGTGSAVAFVYTVEVGYCDGSCDEATDYHTIATSGTITYYKNASLGLHHETIGTGTAQTFTGSNKARMYLKINVITNTAWVSMGFNGTVANYISNLQTPNLTVPENLILLLVVIPFVPLIIKAFLKKKEQLLLLEF